MMGNKVRDYVKTLTPEIHEQLLRDHKEFCTNGFIGECVLREQARELQKFLGIPPSVASITTWMRELVLEVGLLYAEQHFLIED